MTDCYKFEKRLSDFLEGSLNTKEQELFEKHLQVCDHCREKSEQVQLLRNTLSALPRHKASPSFDAVLRANIRRELKTGYSAFHFPKINFAWQLPAFAAAAILFIAVGIFIDQTFIRIHQQSPIASANIILEPQPSQTVNAQSSHKASQESLKITNYVMDRYRTRALKRRAKRQITSISMQMNRNADNRPNDALSFPSQTNFKATPTRVRL